MDDLHKLADDIAVFFEQRNIGWEGYGAPDGVAVAAGVSGILDYLEAEEERVLMEIPSMRILIVKEGDTAQVWVRAGDIDARLSTD
ncbi:MAG: hypothetical protein LC650_00505 [Actinobacteria bacterium]|nr:hypothetical protein [Actinomycetota bacterium]